MGLENTAVEYTLATTGACLWMLITIPQLVKSHREKSTKGLSPHLMSIWASSSLFYGTYTIVSKMNIALQVQPHVLGTLCMCSWAQCMYYDHGVSAKQAVVYLMCILGVSGLLEFSGIFALMYAQEHGTEVPLDFIGYFSTFLTAFGFVPQYYEIWKLREVQGISLIFLSLDILGGCLAASALFFRPELDYVGLSTYLVVVMLDLVIIILSFILNPRAARRRLNAPQPDTSELKDRPASRLSGVIPFHHTMPSGGDRPLSRVSAYRWDPHADDPVSAAEKGVELSPVKEEDHRRPTITTSGIDFSAKSNEGIDVHVLSAGLDTPASDLTLFTPRSPASARTVGWSDRVWDSKDGPSCS